MTGPSRRTLLSGLCSCSALWLAGCATSAEEGRVAPGYRPVQASDEGGLWQIVAKSEEELRQSRFLVRDPALNAYLREIVHRLAPDHAGDVRLYLVRTPQFNASMAPNGMMEVWTGLLLRTQNEAQPAAMLGHELGHFLERHTLQRWRDMRWKTDLAAFAGLGLSAAGWGRLNDLGNLATLASLFAFSREQERAADAIGFELMTRAGYAPVEAARVWEQLVEEKRKAEAKNEPVVFFASHPASEERARTLREKAVTQAGVAADDFAERYRAALRPTRTMLLQDELRMRDYDRTLVVFQTMAAASGEDAELAYFTGEVYRLRDEKGDAALARAAYRRATASADCPAEAWRSLGLLDRRAGDGKAAAAAFERYLGLRPGAADRDMIRSYLQAGA